MRKSCQFLSQGKTYIPAFIDLSETYNLSNEISIVDGPLSLEIVIIGNAEFDVQEDNIPPLSQVALFLTRHDGDVVDCTVFDLRD